METKIRIPSQGEIDCYNDCVYLWYCYKHLTEKSRGIRYVFLKHFSDANKARKWRIRNASTYSTARDQGCSH